MVNGYVVNTNYCNLEGKNALCYLLDYTGRTDDSRPLVRFLSRRPRDYPLAINSEVERRLAKQQEIRELIFQAKDNIGQGLGVYLKQQLAINFHRVIQGKMTYQLLESMCYNDHPNFRFEFDNFMDEQLKKIDRDYSSYLCGYGRLSSSTSNEDGIASSLEFQADNIQLSLL